MPVWEALRQAVLLVDGTKYGGILDDVKTDDLHRDYARLVKEEVAEEISDTEPVSKAAYFDQDDRAFTWRNIFPVPQEPSYRQKKLAQLKREDCTLYVSKFIPYGTAYKYILGIQVRTKKYAHEVGPFLTNADSSIERAASNWVEELRTKTHNELQCKRLMIEVDNGGDGAYTLPARIENKEISFDTGVLYAPAPWELRPSLPLIVRDHIKDIKRKYGILFTDTFSKRLEISVHHTPELQNLKDPFPLSTEILQNPTKVSPVFVKLVGHVDTNYALSYATYRSIRMGMGVGGHTPKITHHHICGLQVGAERSRLDIPSEEDVLKIADAAPLVQSWLEKIVQRENSSRHVDVPKSFVSRGDKENPQLPTLSKLPYSRISEQYHKLAKFDSTLNLQGATYYAEDLPKTWKNIFPITQEQGHTHKELAQQQFGDYTLYVSRSTPPKRTFMVGDAMVGDAHQQYIFGIQVGTERYAHMVGSFAPSNADSMIEKATSNWVKELRTKTHNELQCKRLMIEVRNGGDGVYSLPVRVKNRQISFDTGVLYPPALHEKRPSLQQIVQPLIADIETMYSTLFAGELPPDVELYHKPQLIGLEDPFPLSKEMVQDPDTTWVQLVAHADTNYTLSYATYRSKDSRGATRGDIIHHIWGLQVGAEREHSSKSEVLNEQQAAAHVHDWLEKFIDRLQQISQQMKDIPKDWFVHAKDWFVHVISSTVLQLEMQLQSTNIDDEYQQESSSNWSPFPVPESHSPKPEGVVNIITHKAEKCNQMFVGYTRKDKAFDATHDDIFVGIKVVCDEKCAICLECVADEPFTTACAAGHLFHTNCISEWAAKGDTCPTCRKALVPDLENGKGKRCPIHHFAHKLPSLTSNSELSPLISHWLDDVLINPTKYVQKKPIFARPKVSATELSA